MYEHRKTNVHRIPSLDRIFLVAMGVLVIISAVAVQFIHSQDDPDGSASLGMYRVLGPTTGKELADQIAKLSEQTGLDEERRRAMELFRKVGDRPAVEALRAMPVETESGEALIGR